MINHRLCVIAALSVFCAVSAASVDAASVPVLRIDTDKVVARVSPLHAGLFAEEVNHAFDGGLYAELVADRTLNGALLVKPGTVGAWTAIGAPNSSMAMTVDWSNPVSEAAPASLRVDAGVASPGHRVGVANTGFWGIPVHPNTRYRLSFYAKTQGDYAGPLIVSLEDTDGALTFASFRAALSPGSWKHYVAHLTTPSDVPRRVGHLAISTEQPGTFWLTQASLFLPTWNDQANGQRIDLMQKLADLHPKFLRFPGGSLLNGLSPTERFDWKKTLGSMSDRPGHQQGAYWTSDGMGYLEFLKWCEMFGMEPVLAVYAGRSLSANSIVPAGDALQPFVQDALDEIEYAMGDTSTEWGKQRERDGHPAPFKVGYVEVGNEEIDPAYDARFAQFYDTIKAKYPSIQIIATGQIKDTGSLEGINYYKPYQVKSRVPDILDEHFYLKAKDMFGEVDRFDHYDRKGPKILVGEWAAVEGGPPSNMLGALGDAAWMIGMERNADVVVMQTYSELLVNVNKGGFTWPTGLIGYDALSSFGSPSYYAQVMFNNHRGDEILSTSLSISPDVYTSVTRNSSTGTLYVKTVNNSGLDREVTIKITGHDVIEPEGEEIVLAGGLEDTNSIREPTKILPHEHPILDAGARFRHVFPANSVTVLELHSAEHAVSGRL